MSFGHPLPAADAARHPAGGRSRTCSPSGGACATPSRSRTSTCSRRSSGGARGDASSRRRSSCSRSRRSASRSRGRTARRSSPSDKATVILVVDVSGSMHATDVKPTRLGAAQAAVRTFLERVPKRVRVGLIAFSGEPEVAAPPTTDRDLVRASLDELDFFQAYGGTAIGDALAAAVDSGKKAIRRSRGTPRRRSRYTGRRRRTSSSRSSSSPTASRRAAPRSRSRARSARRRPASPSTRSRSGRRAACSRRPFGGFGGGGRPAAHPGAARPGDAARDRQTTRRQVLQRALRRRAPVRVQGARLEARAASRAARKSTNEVVFLAALLLVAAGILSALWAPRLP